MDASAFVQENKRWLVGCAIGGLVWMIASSVIESVYDTRVGGARSKGGGGDVYDSTALSDAQDESEKLQQERDRLKVEMAFAIAPKYGEWTGPADQHLFLSGRNLKQDVVNSASDRDVAIEEGDITWEVPQGIDQIRRVLFGLDMIDEVQLRLFAAHDASKAVDEDARGLVSIESLKLESDRSRGARRSRGRNRGGVDLRDLLEQQRVSIHVLADEPTIAAFIESCRKPGRTLVLDTMKVTAPARQGDPSTLKATLSGISFLKGE